LGRHFDEATVLRVAHAYEKGSLVASRSLLLGARDSPFPNVAS